ncbi:acylpyruvase FAHD1, mitochondrial-like [Stylophora pistillata]|uniref:acylpyruvase FAHD1, mitochondrial-like n=1 Tax=Stylophora pistillata TaxID=50429 RepID=UPI000C04796B|nr:acylpyruvase FAHD1, mitochondrial-like [Stylophora pistillata]
MASQGRDLRRFVEFGRKIIGVGKNYRPNGSPQQPPPAQDPLIFLKPTSTYLSPGEKIKIPVGRDQIYHEVELGVVIGKTGKTITESQAMEHVGGYALALDMTDFDLITEKNEAIKVTYPWALAKGFDTATPVSEFIPKSAITDPNDVHLWLKVDGETKQDGNTQDMIYKIPHLISFVSRYMTLEEGDLILTGTPEGGSPVKRGQTIICGLGNKIEMTFPVSS